MIRSHPLEFYTKAFGYVTKSRDDEESLFFDRLWFQIFRTNETVSETLPEQSKPRQYKLQNNEVPVRMNIGIRDRAANVWFIVQ